MHGEALTVHVRHPLAVGSAEPPNEVGGLLAFPCSWLGYSLKNTKLILFKKLNVYSLLGLSTLKNAKCYPTMTKLLQLWVHPSSESCEELTFLALSQGYPFFFWGGGWAILHGNHLEPKKKARKGATGLPRTLNPKPQTLNPKP